MNRMFFFFVVAVVLVLQSGIGNAEQRHLNPDNNAMTQYPEQKCVSCHIDEESLPGSSHKIDNLAEFIKKEDCQECHLTYHNEMLKKSGSLHKPVKLQKIDPNSYSTAKPPKNMVYIAAGEFIMGSNDRMPDEKPEHIATTGDYFIDMFEVTNEDYFAFARANNRPLPQLLAGGKIPYGYEKHPVTFVTWYDGQDYCAFRGKRMPTEHEWEKAARGVNGLIFPWGNDFNPEKANVPHLGINSTTPVGSFPKGKSPFGIYDMSGNVWEWVDAVYLPHPGNTEENDNYSDRFKILKGGSFVDCHFYNCGISAPTFNRSFFVPETKNKGFGFRCALTAPSSLVKASLNK